MLVTLYVVPPFVTVEGIEMLGRVVIEFPTTLASAPETVYVILSTVKVSGGLFGSKAGIEFANKVVVQNKTRNSTVFFIIFDLIIYSQNWAVKKRWDCINCSVVLGFEEFCPKLFFIEDKKTDAKIKK
jgi:hypothetical protein